MVLLTEGYEIGCSILRKSRKFVHMRISFYTSTMRNGLVFIALILMLWLPVTTIAQVQKVERQAPPMEQLPQEQNQLVVSYEDEIKEDELPEKVYTSIKENYKDYEITDIYRGSDGSYKVALEKEENKIAAFYDAGGEFLRIENDKQEEEINDDWR